MKTADDSTDGPPRTKFVPTFTLLGYLCGVYLFIFEVLSLLISMWGAAAPPALRWGSFGMCLLLSAYVLARGRSDYRELRHTRGRIALTQLQIVIVTLGVVGIGGISGITLAYALDNR